MEEKRDYVLKKLTDVDQAGDFNLIQSDQIIWKNSGNCGSVILSSFMYKEYEKAIRSLYWDDSKDDEDIEIKWIEVLDKSGTHVEDKLTIVIKQNENIEAESVNETAGTLHMYKTKNRLMFQGHGAQWWFQNEIPKLNNLIDKNQERSENEETETIPKSKAQTEPKVVDVVINNVNEEDEPHSDHENEPEGEVEVKSDESHNVNDSQGGPSAVKSDESKQNNQTTHSQTMTSNMNSMMDNFKKMETAIVEVQMDHSSLKSELDDRFQNLIKSQGTIRKDMTKISETIDDKTSICQCNSLHKKVSDLLTRIVSLESKIAEATILETNKTVHVTDVPNVPVDNSFSVLMENEQSNVSDSEINETEAKLETENQTEDNKGLRKHAEEKKREENKLNQKHNSYEERKYKGKKSDDQQNQVDLLIVTTSIARKLDAQRIYRNKKVVVKELERKTISDACDYISKTKLKPKVVQFFVGGNDIATTPVDEVLVDMGELLSETRLQFPEAEIVVSEVIPRDRPEYFNEDNTKFNLELEV